jgi:CRP-like cAMP-binding protein
MGRQVCKMANGDDGGIESLRDAILRYGEQNPERVRRFARGDRVIQQGAVSDVCFLIRSGTLSVVVKANESGVEAEVALRYAREFIGETAFLQRGVPRNASVVVFSPDAELISLTRSDLYRLLQQEPGLHDAIAGLWELAASRRRETLAVLGGKISIRTRMMSALLADIHNFSTLGEVLWEEELDSFLFDFVESSSDVSHRYDGLFEDQGDGFKIIFAGGDHVNRAIKCATEILDVFRLQRSSRAAISAPFKKIGLGVGICSDFMSVRRRDGSPPSQGRVLSHALNVAAAISKYRESVDEAEVYIDETTFKLANTLDVAFVGPDEILLEKLGRRQVVYRIVRSESKVTSLPRGVLPGPVGSAFISYAHTDKEFVDRLVQRLEVDGVTIWRDNTHIFVGDDIDRAISRGIQENRLFLIVLTPSSIKSDWVAREFDEASHDAISGSKVLLPVLTSGLVTKDLPARIRRKKSVVFSTDFEGPYSILLESIKEHTRRSARLE